ncbi:hypothetical protein CHELA1G11_13048 [Hyphomicrobiales bacterium]|nr:hypothetical protein CHELA1G2_11261 [Hyphomicrobiales bacterium]CAH1668940.1 hypothetical protein CHELA1G11_13048 [Hyphomicrobiales bacterium]
MKRNVEECKSVLADLEKASGADRELDARIDAVLRAGKASMRDSSPWAWLNFPTWRHHDQAAGMCGVVHDDGSFGMVWDSEPFTSSLDATIALVERVLPGHQINLHWYIVHAEASIGSASHPLAQAVAPTPPLALLTALFRALIAQMEKAE